MCSGTKRTRFFAAMILLGIALLPAAGSAELQWTDGWIGSGIGYSWSTYTDLINRHGIMGVSEICVHNNVYVRFRNNDPAGEPLRLRYAFGPVKARPLSTVHRLSLAPRAAPKEGVLVTGVTCDGISRNAYEVYFGPE